MQSKRSHLYDPFIHHYKKKFAFRDVLEIEIASLLYNLVWYVVPFSPKRNRHRNHNHPTHYPRTLTCSLAALIRESLLYNSYTTSLYPINYILFKKVQ